ncbi:hypothetical protein T265_07666 [Opisthorchis viverrini]|uniref:Anaphase-promoting complex subunit 4-like WD40 domain-containing protein n=1 Tax=Opisthorchis viverrini TaxID=6198 RepID=A0A075AB14_OPIVI|nr:hypothetical protein T265_07666 [Opisthorchis viverrini]KER24779.1 hypothetical protein T265_07666 [Opisthorchis viverrini]
MVGEYSYCPVEAKHYLKNKVSHCCWSPRTDLIALGSLNGRVSVHRYKLACIWELSPPHQNSVVNCVVWRPDGKCLAVAYDSGHVRLILANDGFVYKEFEYATSITYLNWTAGLLTKQDGKGSNAHIYFPDLSSLTMFQSDVNFNTSDTFKLSQLLADSEEHFFILTVYCAGVLNFYGSDSFLIARWACKPNLLSTELQFKFLGCQFSACLKYLLILYSWTEDTTGRSFMELQWVPTTGLVTFGTQLRNLSMHHSLIRISKTLLDKGFDQICTSWEDMILEMDVKFTNYAKERLSRNKSYREEYHSLTRILQMALCWRLQLYKHTLLSSSIPSQSVLVHLTAGLFHYCPKATLADLIMHTLEDDITALFGPPVAGDFDRACFGFAESVSQLLCCEQAYEIQDLEFFTPELLTLLLRQTARASSSGTTEEPSSTSHIVMVPVQLLLAACDEDISSTPVSTACEPLWSSSNCHLPTKRLSELITSAHVESLPCTATKLATNGGRSILFVLFEGSCMCRVYLLDCPETDGSVVRDDGEDGVGDAVMEAGDSDVVENVT